MNRITPIAAAVALVLAQAALAQQDQRVEITGSAIKRVDAEGALPVTVITREEIARSGFTNTEELVASLAAVSSMNGINNATGAGSSTNGRSTISLRGLDGGHTLVLVNGRRVAVAVTQGTVSAANINNIPLAAIERVEVLKDGASSIYGSDALAGVINFILTKDFRGIEVGASAGQPTRDGGGKTQRATLVGGMGDITRERYNLTAALSVEKESQLFAKDRDFARTGNFPPFVVSGATGQGNIEGGYTPGRVVGGVWQVGTRQPGFGGSPGAGYGNPLAAANRCGEVGMFRDLSLTSKGTPYCTFDSESTVGLIPERESTNFSLNGVFRASDALELFGDVIWSKNIVIQRFQPSPVRRSFLDTDALFKEQGIDPVLLIRPSNPNYKLAADFLAANGFSGLVGQPLAITSRVFDFGPRTQRDVTEQTRFVLGARGEFLGQGWEAAYSDIKYELTGTVPDGYFSQVAFARAVQNSNDWNPWTLNQSEAFKQAIAPAKYTGSTFDGTTTAKILDLKLSGDALKVPAGTASYAVGLQFRDESFQSRPSPALFTGDIAGLGGAQGAVDRDRRVSSGFGEIVVPILKTLEGNASARHDRYDDVGNASTYKLSLRWQPVRSVVLRAGRGTGFRAPALTELWQPQTLGSSAQFTDPKFPNNPNIQVNELTGGNPDLKPVKSTQTTLGLVFSPIDGTTIAIDWWKLDVKDIITAPSTQEIVSRFRAGDPAYAGLVKLTPDGQVDETIALLQNVGKAKIDGIDLDASARFKAPGGRVDVNLQGTYYIRYDQTSPGGTISRKVGTLVEDFLDADGSRVSQPVLDSTGGGVVLRWRHRLSATYTVGDFGFTLTQNFYTGYRTGDRQVDGEKHFVPDQSIFDANISYSGIKNLRLTLGVKNLADKNPPMYVPVSNQFQSAYDISLYDPRSRFVYLSANYRF